MRVDHLTRDDEAAAVASLAAAFAEYPLLAALCPDAGRRPRVTEAFCRFFFRAAVRAGGAFGTPDRAAVACAWPPGRWRPSWIDAVRAGGLPLLWHLGWRCSAFSLRLGRELDAVRAGHVPGPHWYVVLLGVRPDVQRTGLGRTLVEAVFADADRAGVPVYLETVLEKNAAIYQKLGFELRGRRELPRGLVNWELVRGPETSSGV